MTYCVLMGHLLIFLFFFVVLWICWNWEIHGCLLILLLTFFYTWQVIFDNESNICFILLYKNKNLHYTKTCKAWGQRTYLSQDEWLPKEIMMSDSGFYERITTTSKKAKMIQQDICYSCNIQQKPWFICCHLTIHAQNNLICRNNKDLFPKLCYFLVISVHTSKNKVTKD